MFEFHAYPECPYCHHDQYVTLMYNNFLELIKTTEECESCFKEFEVIGDRFDDRVDCETFKVSKKKTKAAR